MLFPKLLEQRARVLLVDDNSDHRFLIEELCKAFSFPVELVAVGSLKSAEVKWREREFLAVLLRTRIWCCTNDH